MTAPQSSPDLSVVSPDSTSTESEGSAPTTGGSPQEETAEVGTSSGAAAASPAAADATVEEKRRRGVPIWVLLILAIGAAFLFASQYQRAEQLGAQVVSLTAELEAAGQQLDAYKGHLQLVRTSVSDLNQQIGALDSLVNQDPLAPADPQAAAGSVAGEAASAPETVEPASPAASEGSPMTDTPAPFAYDSFEGATSAYEGAPAADERAAATVEGEGAPDAALGLSEPVAEEVSGAEDRGGDLLATSASSTREPLSAASEPRETPLRDVYSLDPPPFNSSLYHERPSF